MNLNIKHIGALALLILGVSIALVVVSVDFVKGDQGFNRVINVAGKQRMLSQRIFKDVYKLDLYPGNTSAIVANLGSSYAEFIKAHEGLLHGDTDLGVPASTNPEVFAQHEKITSMLIPIRKNLEALLSDKDNTDLAPLLANARHYENTLLKELNALVIIFEQEANSASGQLNRVYISAGLFYFFVLALCLSCGYWLVRRMKSGVRQMRDQSAGLQLASETITESSQDLSTSGIEQESAVSQTLAALVQINAVISKNCESAQLCLNKIENVKKMSSEGNEAIINLASSLNTVNSSVDALEEFNNILSAVEAKTQVIDDIVLKTQLLSVNASIEAERAGEFGVGFSVVAEEVGKLAITSGNEAREIKRLINDSFSKVKELVENSRKTTAQGLQSCDHSRELYQSIDDEFQRVNEQMRDITDASLEQEAGIKQVNNSMNSMKESIHINSRSASRYREMASSFTDDARSLGELANVFSRIMGITMASKQSSVRADIASAAPLTGQKRSLESLINQANELQTAQNDPRLVDADHETFKKKSAVGD